ncbi:MarR family transcriptional regulator [Rossellomorea sp. H39__3]
MKQIIYESYLELLHLNEQKADSIQSLFGIYLNKDEPLDLLPGNMTSIHVIQCIGDHEPINHKGISRTMMISKANITKVTRKLQEDGLIRTVKLNDNKKKSTIS